MSANSLIISSMWGVLARLPALSFRYLTKSMLSSSVLVNGSIYKPSSLDVVANYESKAACIKKLLCWSLSNTLNKACLLIVS